MMQPPLCVYVCLWVSERGGRGGGGKGQRLGLHQPACGCPFRCVHLQDPPQAVGSKPRSTFRQPRRHHRRPLCATTVPTPGTSKVSSMTCHQTVPGPTCRPLANATAPSPLLPAPPCLLHPPARPFHSHASTCPPTCSLRPPTFPPPTPPAHLPPRCPPRGRQRSHQSQTPRARPAAPPSAAAGAPGCKTGAPGPAPGLWESRERQVGCWRGRTRGKKVVCESMVVGGGGGGAPGCETGAPGSGPGLWRCGKTRGGGGAGRVRG